MPGKVVPAMRHAAVILSLVFNGGFQLDSDTVAIAAKTAAVTAGADTAVSTGHLPVIIGKKHTVVQFLIGNLCFLHIMASGAMTKIFPLFFWMPQRRCITTLNGCTGNHKHDRQNNSAQSQ